MVLDGDAGEISASQRQLLQEAFTSSERMVHLISDFLNVSRLQTGKFVIDQVQTDLVSLVAEEVANVSQVASAHKVNVRFRKPARFPLLYLDENKLRQVIMNLIDNAIYYSPNADTVRVRLSIEDGDVVLRVVDHGMGVPKDAQKRLFTKFFRAERISAADSPAGKAAEKDRSVTFCLAAERLRYKVPSGKIEQRALVIA